MFKYWSLLLSHESWSRSCERRSSGLNVAFITNPAWGAGRLSLLTKVLLIFLFFSHFLIQSFLFFLFSQSWVPYFPIFLSIHGTGFLRLRNSAWDFWGLIFGPGIFWGVVLEALGISLGFDFCPHSIIPITWNPEYLQPWGEGELIHKRHLFDISFFTCIAYEVGIFWGETGYWSMSLF